MRYMLKVESIGARARIGLNRAPLAVDVSGEGQTLERPVGEWVLPPNPDEKDNPRNRLTVFLVWPPGVSFEPGKARVTAEVIEVAEGGVSRTLASFSWPIASIPERYPFYVEVPFVLREAPKTRLFEEADVIEELTDDDRRQIWETLSKLRGMVCPMTDPKAAYEMTRYKHDDLGRALQKDLGAERDTAILQYGMLRHLKNPTIVPMTKDDMVTEVVSDKRVVYVTNGIDREAIELKETPETPFTYAFDIFMSRVGGKWIISR